MKLTAKSAVDKAIKHWKWCAETGKDKEKYPPLKSDDPSGNCYLCEYDENKWEVNSDTYTDRLVSKYGDCCYCPLNRYFGKECSGKGVYYRDWILAGSSVYKRKEAAAGFVAQLEEIREHL